jgi:diaminopimelate decarboxylase
VFIVAIAMAITSCAHLRILIVGVDSGPDPHPGVGVACSLRSAYPSCELVALDRSPQSSGLNWPGFDKCIVLPSRSIFAQRCASLGPNEYLIPCDDGEICRLAADVQGNKRVLMPSIRCLRQIRKPAQAVARFLGVEAPRSILIPAKLQSLDTFLQKCTGHVWRKGRVTGAERVKQETVLSSREFVTGNSESLSMDELLQAHVEGSLEVLSFAAYWGRFLNGVWMVKKGVTSRGKTWSGIVTQLSEEWRLRLESLVRRFAWHGGGELEFIRDSHARLWLIDINPRFPAWIHGSTVCGINLPGELLSAASGRGALKGMHKSKAFSRVVVEVSVRSELESRLRPHIVD